MVRGKRWFAILHRKNIFYTGNIPMTHGWLRDLVGTSPIRERLLRIIRSIILGEIAIDTAEEDAREYKSAHTQTNAHKTNN